MSKREKTKGRGKEKDKQCKCVRAKEKENEPESYHRIWQITWWFLVSFIYSMFAFIVFKCLFACVNTFVWVCEYVYAHANMPLFLLLSCSLQSSERERCEPQWYNSLNVILNATKSFVLSSVAKMWQTIFLLKSTTERRRKERRWTYIQFIHMVWAYECCGQMSSIRQWVCA